MVLDPRFFQEYVQPTPEPWRYSGALGNGIRQAVALAEQLRAQRAREKLERADMAQQRELALLSEQGAMERTKMGTLDVENLRQEHRMAGEGRARAAEREERKRVIRSNYLEAMSRGDHDAADMWVAEGAANGLEIHGAEPAPAPPQPQMQAPPEDRGYGGPDAVQGTGMSWLPGMSGPVATRQETGPIEPDLKPMPFDDEERVVPEGYVAVTDMDTGESQWVKVAGFRQRKGDRIEQIRQVIRPYMDADEQAVTQVAAELESRYPGTPAEDFKQFEGLLHTLLGARLNRKKLAAANAKKAGKMRASGADGAIPVYEFNALSKRAEEDFKTTLVNMKAANLGSDINMIDAAIRALSKRGTEHLAEQNKAIYDIVVAAQGSRPTDLDFKSLSGLGSMWDDARKIIQSATDNPQMQDMQRTRVLNAANAMRRQLVEKKYSVMRTAVEKYNSAPSEIWRDAYAARMYSIFDAKALQALGVKPPRDREEKYDYKENKTFIRFRKERESEAPLKPLESPKNKAELDLD